MQRRHQKLVEETPAPNLPEAVRNEMCAAAVRLAKAAGYQNAGTAEFLVDQQNCFYFIEVNARIQVEHPVTELATSIDLVKEQIRVAAGEPLSFRQEDVIHRGAVFECRINAEDPANDFRACTGELAYVRFPDHGVRVETGVESGSVVTPYYDSMLAKLITHADTRDEALDRLKQALDDTSIFGITTNQGFLERLIDLPATRSATFYTRLIDDQIDQLVDKTKATRHRSPRAWCVFLDHPAAPGRRGEPVAVARHDGMAHGRRRRGIVADTDPPS